MLQFDIQTTYKSKSVSSTKSTFYLRNIIVVLSYLRIVFSALALLVGRQEEHLT